MNCKLTGNFAKMIQVELAPGEEFYGERGSTVYVEDGISMTSEGNGKSLGKLLGAKLSGESFLIVHFRNNSHETRRLALGKHTCITHVKIDPSSSLICKSGAYFASNRHVDIDTRLSIASLFGGNGALLQRLSGDATVFLECFGDPVVIDLQYGQKVRVDENHFLAAQGISDGKISPDWSLKNIFGGEGLSLLEITGPGRVFVNP